MLRNRKALHVPSYSYNTTIDDQKKTRDETGSEQKRNSYKTRRCPENPLHNHFLPEKITHNKLLCFSLFSPPSRNHRKRRKGRKVTMRTYEKCPLLNWHALYGRCSRSGAPGAPLPRP